jgi:lipid II:glycine glycyltransferase (peptidoglycan interpeptide bridge formation enzyme)
MPTGGPAVDRCPSARPSPRNEPEVIVEAEPDAATLRAWDRLVADTPGSDVAQLSAWAQIRRRAGFSPLYVLARVAGEPVGGALVLHRRPVPGLGSVAYLPFGPVLPAGPRRGEIADAVGRALADLARQRLAALFVQPMAGDTDVAHGLLRLGFRPSTAGITPAASIAIKLSAPVDRLRADVRSGTRASIRRAAAQGVQVRRGGADDLGVVADLLAHTAEHHGFAAASPEHLGELYRALEPGHIVIFVA